MADANAKRISVDDIRNAVVKSSDIRLREELIGTQTFYSYEDVSQLNRQELLRHVLQIRTLNNSHLKCQSIMSKFDLSFSQPFREMTPKHLAHSVYLITFKGLGEVFYLF